MQEFPSKMKIFLKLSAVFLAGLTMLSLLLLPCFGLNTVLKDDAGLLTKTEAAEVEEHLIGAGENRNCLVAVVTAEHSPYNDYENEAYRLVESFDTNNVVLLYLDMGAQAYRIETKGNGTRALNDDALDYIEDSFIDDLRGNRFFMAFIHFADSTGKVLKSYNDGREFKAAFPLLRNLFISLLVGGFVAFLVVIKLKNDLKTVKIQNSASNFIKRDSLNVTLKKDIFLYRTVTRVARPKQSSGSSRGYSSRGGGHGGGHNGGHGGRSGRF